MEKALKPYMGYSRAGGSHEGAVLIFAHSGREAKRISWSTICDLFTGGDFTDVAVRRLYRIHLFEYVDHSLFEQNKPHIIESPPVCKNCELWGDRLNADGMCDSCLAEL